MFKGGLYSVTPRPSALTASSLASAPTLTTSATLFLIFPHTHLHHFGNLARKCITPGSFFLAAQEIPRKRLFSLAKIFPCNTKTHLQSCCIFQTFQRFQDLMAASSDYHWQPCRLLRSCQNLVTLFRHC